MTKLTPEKKREYNQTYAAKRRANFNMATAIHGTKATYDFGKCRCDVCRTYNKDRRAHARIPYGVTQAQYNEMFEAQGGVCAICGMDGRIEVSNSTQRRRLSIDHDHITGRIRGLLCFHCNTGIGKLGDSVEGLQKALDYLQKQN